MPPYLQCGRFQLSLSKPLVMGILNLTPDSFSDGGRYTHLETALSRAEQMIAEGVDIIDIGGESSRPGAVPLTLEEELERVMPVVYALQECGKPLSIDTYKPQIMQEVLSAGADMINDINGFRSAGAMSVVKKSDCALCIMHMQHEPQTMQLQPQYDNVLEDVIAFLKERVNTMMQEGIAANRLCVDPGFGFGKTVEHNLVLLKNIDTIEEHLQLPVLAGLSRKSTIGVLTGRPVEERMAGSVAAALAAVHNGARLVRVHDVAETVDALKVWNAAQKT
ncbi:dihydropteroate synthase [Oxalobacteraceae bacterium R-40]|uniref:Dihydropteroate synthase n=1 Tax=Keguizhuia sedimenti TaxID=3064264 RepID=A0ABU1BMR2_9BURK|nr:dihydropteroate synthase [Oxalobacteraceae bacterium R-40]